MPQIINANSIENGMCLCSTDKQTLSFWESGRKNGWVKATIHSPVRVKTAEAYGQVG